MDDPKGYSTIMLKQLAVPHQRDPKILVERVTQRRDRTGWGVLILKLYIRSCSFTVIQLLCRLTNSGLCYFNKDL